MKWRKESSELYVGYVDGIKVAQIQKHQRTRNGYGRWPNQIVVETFWIIVEEESGSRTIFSRLKDAKSYVQYKYGEVTEE